MRLSFRALMYVLSEKTFWQLPPFPRLPDGIQAVVIGWVELLVTCLEKTVRMPFMVVPVCSSCSIFLGANWIRRSRAVLKSDGNGLRVTFDGKKEKKEYRTSHRCSPPCVKVYVDEIGVVSAIVDTSSSKSTVREDWLTHNQMLEAIVPHYIMTNIANGTNSKKLGLVSLNITPLQDQHKITTCIETVEVALNLSQTLILGMDWIYKTGTTIQLTK